MNQESQPTGPAAPPTRGFQQVLVVLFWLFVGVPLSCGVYHTLLQAIKLFE